MPSNRDLRVMAVLGALVVALAAAQTVAGIDVGLLHLAPALVLALPLLAGRYVGEERLAALGAYRRPVGRVAAEAPPRQPSRTLVLGGRLIAAVVVERGPPAAFAIAR